MIRFVTPEDTIEWTHDQPVVKARLHSPRHGSITLPYTDTHIGPVPQDTRDGFYELLVDTECGCFRASARVMLCSPPEFVASHTHTFPDADTVAPECCPQ